MMSEDQLTGHENNADQRAMSAYGYKQELRRTIRLFGSFAVAFSFISITTGIFANYELVLDRSGPAGIWTWPVVIIGQLLVALVFAELAAKIPLTGYSYQWVTRLAGQGWGWFTGWLSVCFLIIVIPSVDHSIASVVGHVWEIPDGSSELKWIVYSVIALQALIHVFGVRFADLINSAAVFTEVVGMLGLVCIFTVLIFRNQPSFEILFARASLQEGQSYLPVWIMASLMGAYTIVGFESAANLSEETINASRTVPKAVIGSVVISGVVGMFFLVVTVLGIQDLDTVIKSDYPLPLIIENNLGKTVAQAFFLLVVISIFACGLIIMASGSRMVFAMARDNVFRGSTMLCRVSSRTGAPIPAILFVASLGVLAECFSESLEQLLAAAAVLPALVYLLTVVTYTMRRKSLATRPGQFSLGRWGMGISLLAIIWLLLIIAVLSIPREFHKATVVSFTVCGLGVILYWGWIRRRMVTGKAGVRTMQIQDFEGNSHSER